MRSNNRMMLIGAALAGVAATGMTMAAGDYPGGRVSNPKPRKRYVEPTPESAAETDADRQRIRRAQQKRERQIARQSKGMQAQGGC